jgi:hypothetical protein
MHQPLLLPSYLRQSASGMNASMFQEPGTHSKQPYNVIKTSLLSCFRNRPIVNSPKLESSWKPMALRSWNSGNNQCEFYPLRTLIRFMMFPESPSFRAYLLLSRSPRSHCRVDRCIRTYPAGYPGTPMVTLNPASPHSSL